jgi:hypothetical protein
MVYAHAQMSVQESEIEDGQHKLLTVHDSPSCPKKIVIRLESQSGKLLE